MKKFKRIICLLMVPVFLSLCSCSQVNNNGEDETAKQVKYTTPAGLVQKNETVYVNLDCNGNPTQTIVSDWIHTDKAQVYVDDVTNLSEIENIKDDTVPTVSGQNLRWNMNTTDLYYQGTTEAALPISFEINYAFNGKPAVPEDIIGKSGKVDITVKMHNLDPHNVTVNGRTMAMYNPLLVVGGVTLSEDKFQNIRIKNGKTTGNGNSQIAVFVGFPGINDSLGLTDLSENTNQELSYTFDDTFGISADVTDFELGNFMFGAIPIASLDIGLNGITNSMDDVRDNLSKLQGIQSSLQSLDANGLLTTLTSNPNKINDLSKLISKAANLYDNNKALIDVINKYSTRENMETIEYLTAYISEADYDELENALGIINTFFGDKDSSAKIQKGMNLLRSLSEDLKKEQVQAAIQNLPQTVSTISSLQDALNENKDLINALRVLSQSNTLNSLSSALSSVEGSIAAGSLSQYATITGDADEITAKMTAWIELGKRYTIFTKKAGTMDSSVMFVFKADGLKTGEKAKDTKNVKSNEPVAEESSGLGALYKKIFG